MQMHETHDRQRPCPRVWLVQRTHNRLPTPQLALALGRTADALTPSLSRPFLPGHRYQVRRPGATGWDWWLLPCDNCAGKHGILAVTSTCAIAWRLCIVRQNLLPNPRRPILSEACHCGKRVCQAKQPIRYPSRRGYNCVIFIFRLLLKITELDPHQVVLTNFCGALRLNTSNELSTW